MAAHLPYDGPFDAFDFNPRENNPSISSQPASGCVVPADIMDQPGLPGIDVAATNAVLFSSDMSDPFLSITPSQPYQYVTDIGRVTVEENDTNTPFWDPFNLDPDPASILEPSSQAALVESLMGYINYDPSAPLFDANPMHGDPSLATPGPGHPSGFNATSASHHTPARAHGANCTVVSTPPTHSPSTPGTAGSSGCKIAGNLLNKPIELPTTQPFAAFHPDGTPLASEKGYIQRLSASCSPKTNAGASPQSHSGKKSLASPFKMPMANGASGGRARSDTTPLSNPFQSSTTPAVFRRKRALPTDDDVSPTSTPSSRGRPASGKRTKSGSSKSPSSAPGSVDKRWQSAAAQVSPSRLPAAKRIKPNNFGLDATVPRTAQPPNAAPITPPLFNYPGATASAPRPTLGSYFNDDNISTYKWLGRESTDPDPPQSLIRRQTGFDFPIPLPTGILATEEAALNRLEEEIDVKSSPGAKQTMYEPARNFLGTANAQAALQSQGQSHNQSLVNVPTGSPAFGQGQMQTINVSPSQLLAQSWSPSRAPALLHSPMFMSAPIVGQTPVIPQSRAQVHDSATKTPLTPTRLVQMQQQYQHRRQLSTTQIPAASSLLPRSTLNLASPAGPNTPTPASRRLTQLLGQGMINSPFPSSDRTKSSPSSGRSQNTPLVGSGPGLFSPLQFQQPTPSSSLTGLHSHLPTPQKPISTGSAPNTGNETLEETNARTAARLRQLGAPVLDFDPNWVTANDAPEGFRAFLPRPGENRTFDELISGIAAAGGVTDGFLPPGMVMGLEVDGALSPDPYVHASVGAIAVLDEPVTIASPVEPAGVSTEAEAVGEDIGLTLDGHGLSGPSPAATALISPVSETGTALTQGTAPAQSSPDPQIMVSSAPTTPVSVVTPVSATKAPMTPPAQVATSEATATAMNPSPDDLPASAFAMSNDELDWILDFDETKPFDLNDWVM